MENEDGPVELWIVDWEAVGFGDPAWDVAGALQDFLVYWVFSMPMSHELTPEQMIAQARVPLGEFAHFGRMVGLHGRGTFGWARGGRIADASCGVFSCPPNSISLRTVVRGGTSSRTASDVATNCGQSTSGTRACSDRALRNFLGCPLP